MSRFLASPVAQVTAALVPVALAIVAAARGDAAAGVVFLALALAIACTVLRLHLKKETRR